MNIEEGQTVKSGDILARLDPKEHEARLNVARAELKLAEAELMRAKVGRGHESVDTAEAKLGLAQARVALARIGLERTVIRAPVGGTVLVKHAEVGMLLDPKGFNVNHRVCELADLRAMEVEVYLAEQDLEKVALGQPCLVGVTGAQRKGFTCKGRVSRISPVADVGKGAVAVRVRLDLAKKNSELRPGLSALVSLLAKE